MKLRLTINMKRLTLFFALLLLLIIHLGCISHATSQFDDSLSASDLAAGEPKETQTDTNFCTTVKHLVTTETEYASNHLNLQVFLDPKEFEETKLIELFRFLVKKYDNYSILSVNVETDWSKVNWKMCSEPTPGTGMSEMPPDPTRNSSYRAFFRSNDDQI